MNAVLLLGALEWIAKKLLLLVVAVGRCHDDDVDDDDDGASLDMWTTSKMRKRYVCTPSKQIIVQCAQTPENGWGQRWPPTKPQLPAQ
jgi:hypothetical protein